MVCNRHRHRRAEAREDALRASERELRQMVDSVPGMIAVANSAGQQEYANKRFLDFTRTTLDDATGLDGLNLLIHPDERAMVTNEWLRSYALGQPLELDHRLKRFDGVYRWVHVRDRSASWTIEVASSAGTVCSRTSTTKGGRKTQLRQSERHLRLARGNDSCPCLALDSRRHAVTMSNRRVVDYTGSELEQIGLARHPSGRSKRSLCRNCVSAIEIRRTVGRHRIDSGAPTENFAGSTIEIEPLRDAERSCGRVGIP